MQKLARPIEDFIEHSAGYVSRIRLSIRVKLLLSFLVVILVSGSLNALLVVRALDYKRQYDSLIDNITTANSLNGYVKPAIDSAMWDIVKGQTRFEDGRQYEIINEVNAKIQQMSATTDAEGGKKRLEVIRRTMNTLGHYVDLLGQQMRRGSKYDENVQALDNIRGVSELVEEGFQDYMLFEVNRTGQKYRETQASFMTWVLASLGSMAGVVIFSILMAWIISTSIYLPIQQLYDLTSTITREDLSALLAGQSADEITVLGMSFNILIDKLRRLLDEKIREQENLKKAEMRVLQAQINPHFLYNTLDTIIWLAEAQRTEQVVDLVRALSNFFRVTLSKGRDWIKISEEIEHVRSYLTIQKVRYQDILDYRLEVEPAILEGSILKLTLQPLVENALYHGIKNKRSGGTITVRGGLDGPGQVYFQVQDDGIGMSPEQLARIRASLLNVPEVVEIGEHGYGIFNVHKRIKMYYGEAYGLEIDSASNQGTRVTLRIPLN